MRLPFVKLTRLVKDINIGDQDVTLHTEQVPLILHRRSPAIGPSRESECFFQTDCSLDRM